MLPNVYNYAVYFNGTWLFTKGTHADDSCTDILRSPANPFKFVLTSKWVHKEKTLYTQRVGNIKINFRAKILLTNLLYKILKFTHILFKTDKKKKKFNAHFKISLQIIININIWRYCRLITVVLGKWS